MKRTKIIYWIVTILFAGFMLFSSIPGIMMAPDNVAFITGLGFPKYFVPFLGWVKALGVIAILIPGFPRIKEWAYAGLVFDLVGAVYSITASAGQLDALGAVFMAVIIGMAFASYFLYHKKEREAGRPVVR